MMILLVFGDDRRLSELSGILCEVGVVQSAKSIQQAARLLAVLKSPVLIFSDLVLPDGTWEDLIGAAKRAPKPADIVVVSDPTDDSLFIEALDRGAFDFVTPPFDAQDLAFIVRSAEWDLAKRQQERDRAA
jgi:DNA-binding NtrC family response regulator